MKKTTRLSLYVENPDNPQTTTDERMARLVGKLRRVPEGLAAIRVAYVTDDPRFPGRGMVLSGNKRLRALKEIYGDGGEVPGEWFQDITALTPEQRREFIIDANTNEGEWDVARLLEQYERDELAALMDAGELEELIKGHVDADDFGDDFSLPDEKEHNMREIAVPCTAEQFHYIMGVIHGEKQGVEDRNGDIIERIFKQWEEQKKSC